MKKIGATVLFSGIVLCLTQCSPSSSSIENVNEIPLTSIDIPEYNTGLHRAQSLYFLHGAASVKERQDRLGQYYVVSWYHADGDKACTLEMLYTQGSTGSKILKKSFHFPKGDAVGSQTSTFAFIGNDHRTLGNILSWKINLIQGGKVIASKESYLWDDK